MRAALSRGDIDSGILSFLNASKSRSSAAPDGELCGQLLLGCCRAGRLADAETVVRYLVGCRVQASALSVNTWYPLCNLFCCRVHALMRHHIHSLTKACHAANSEA